MKSIEQSGFCLMVVDMEEINLKKKGRENVFNLLTRIQDEVHRFVLSFHHQTAQNRQLTSILDEIPGIGPKRNDY